MGPRFPNDRHRRLIEEKVSKHRGRPWVARTVAHRDELASHPCAILADDGFAVFAKLNAAANSVEQFEIGAAVCNCCQAAGVRTPTLIGDGIISTDDGALLVLEASGR
jgi:hypothetical protein